MNFSSASPASGPPATERVDKWLWTVRVFKTRALAIGACRAGWVKIADQPVKASRDLRGGEVVEVKQGLVTRTLRVVAFPGRRVAAKVLAGFVCELTPPEEFAKARRDPVQNILARPKGAGRPTKRDRREIDRLFG